MDLNVFSDNCNYRTWYRSVIDKKEKYLKEDILLILNPRYTILPSSCDSQTLQQNRLLTENPSTSRAPLPANN